LAIRSLSEQILVFQEFLSDTLAVFENPRVGGSIDSNRLMATLTLKGASGVQNAAAFCDSNRLMATLTLRAASLSWFALRTDPPLATTVLRGTRRFKSVHQAQRFPSTHAAVYSPFNLGRRLIEVNLSVPWIKISSGNAQASGSLL